VAGYRSSPARTQVERDDASHSAWTFAEAPEEGSGAVKAGD
jgi:hypothetical protein